MNNTLPLHRERLRATRILRRSAPLWVAAGLLVPSLALASSHAVTLPGGRGCLPGTTATHVTLAPGVERYRCETPAMPGVPLGVAHGPELLTIAAPCSPKTKLRIERFYVRGVQTGDEEAEIDGKPLYWLALLDGRVAGLMLAGAQGRASKTTVAWTRSQVGKRTCMGLHVCGQPTGYAECTTPDGHHRGGFVGGVAEGPGERVFRNGARLVGTFSAGKAHGVGTRVGRDGTRFTTLFVAGKAEGLGFTEFARGQRRAAHYESGKRQGRAVWTSRTGRRHVSVWHGGRKLHQRPESMRALGKPAAPEPSTPTALLWSVEHDDASTTLHTWRIGKRAAVARKAAEATLRARGVSPRVSRAKAPRGYPLAVAELRATLLNKHRTGRFAHVDHGIVGADPEVEPHEVPPVTLAPSKATGAKATK